MNTTWSEIITRAESLGLTQTDIAIECGASQSHISDLRNGKKGKRIGFDLAQALLALDQRLTDKQAA